ncbi:SsgA family sporulation/cell division regulator [Nocardioides panaciterrulae]|uniref:Sporulation and cell division protein SsgA n=1 Tax=Nocardioides panaciterrulae TaxID=661492 RepID=A0A7Y9E6N2_9ACTN|nr:hypothetical protein [Nocardioides panaciterrulae]
MSHKPGLKALSQELTLQCIDAKGRGVELVASFGYDPEDPFAVWITFPSAQGDIRWAMCRQTLLKGLTDPAGAGDLEMWPSIDHEGRAVVVLEFRSPAGRLVAQAHTHEVYRFLTRTLAVVPLGTESDQLDVDAMLTGLLGSRSD